MFFKLSLILLVCLPLQSSAGERTELVFSSAPGNNYRNFCLQLFDAYNRQPGSLKIKAVDINLARAYKFLINDTIDGNCGRVQGFSQLTEESRDKIIELAPPLMEVRFLILAKNKKIADKLRKSVLDKDLSIGVPAGAKFFETYFKNNRSYPVGDSAIGLNMLAAGRLDALFAMPTPDLFEKLKTKPHFYILQMPQLKFKVVSVINKKNLKHKKELERVIKILVDNTTIDKLNRFQHIQKLISEYKKRAH